MRNSTRPRLSFVLAFLSRVFLVLAVLVLAACQQGVGGLTGQNQPDPKPVAQRVKIPLSDKVNGQKVGNGPVRVALLLPISAQGGGGVVGKQMANAARIAVRDFGAGRLQVVIKDTKGQAATSQLLAEEAKNEGATLILGPLFSANVSAASGVTKQARVPMVAFTSDSARASLGVYLLSVTPQSDVRRTLGYGLSKGANRIVAILPQGIYGAIVEREMRAIAKARGAQILSVARYNNTAESINTAVRSSFLATANATAIYIPDGGSRPTAIIKGLLDAGARLEGKLLLGSGQWESANLRNPVLNSGLFAGPPKENFATFANRYRTTYGSRPSSTAALAYDAVSLAAELVRRNPQLPFTAQALQSPSGFNGATGLFRFRSNGLVERGLVINQVQQGRTTVVSPAPKGFTAGG